MPVVRLLKVHFNSLMALAIRGLSVLAGFALTFYIGHALGPVANGQYALITQTAMFLSVVAVGGIDMAVVRSFSAAAARGIRLDRGTFLRTLGWSMAIAGVLIAAILVGGGHLLEILLKQAMPASAVAILVLILVSRTLTRIMSAVLRSQRRYILGQAVEVLIIPTAVLVALLLGLAGTIERILWWTAGLGIATGLLGLRASYRLTGSDADALRVPIRSLMKVAGPLWGVAISLNVADWYSLATAAAVLSVYDAGLYRVAFQIGTALAIVNMGLYTVFSTQISAAYALGDRAEIGRLTRSATRLSAVFVLPAAAILFVFAHQILALIGPEFVAAVPVLRVVLVGQALYAITGPAGLTLAMTGNERINLGITLVSTLSLFIVAPIAAAQTGLLGIAGYVSLILVGRNLASLWAVHRRVGINVMTGRVLPVAH